MRKLRELGQLHTGQLDLGRRHPDVADDRQRGGSQRRKRGLAGGRGRCRRRRGGAASGSARLAVLASGGRRARHLDRGTSREGDTVLFGNRGCGDRGRGRDGPRRVRARPAAPGPLLGDARCIDCQQQGGDRARRYERLQDPRKAARTDELALEGAVARHECIPLLGVGIVMSRFEPETLLGRQEAEPRNLCEGAGLL